MTPPPMTPAPRHEAGVHDLVESTLWWSKRNAAGCCGDEPVAMSTTSTRRSTGLGFRIHPYSADHRTRRNRGTSTVPAHLFDDGFAQRIHGARASGSRGRRPRAQQRSTPNAQERKPDSASALRAASCWRRAGVAEAARGQLKGGDALAEIGRLRGALSSGAGPMTQSCRVSIMRLVRPLTFYRFP
jgi:hypothetical protein